MYAIDGLWISHRVLIRPGGLAEHVLVRVSTCMWILAREENKPKSESDGIHQYRQSNDRCPSLMSCRARYQPQIRSGPRRPLLSYYGQTFSGRQMTDDSYHGLGLSTHRPWHLLAPQRTVSHLGEAHKAYRSRQSRAAPGR